MLHFNGGDWPWLLQKPFQNGDLVSFQAHAALGSLTSCIGNKCKRVRYVSRDFLWCTRLTATWEAGGG
jgi:hypothetical protein